MSRYNVKVSGKPAFVEAREHFSSEPVHREMLSVPTTNNLEAEIIEDADLWFSKKRTESKPGRVCFVGEGGLGINCPGCGHESYLPFEGATSTTKHGPSWEWNGDKVQPTLSPSVHSTGCCGWHGWLRKGIWISQ